jgi:exonuclease VII small subunit
MEEAARAEEILKRYNKRLQRLEKGAENIDESIEDIKTIIKEKQDTLEAYTEDFELKEQELYEAGMIIMKLGKTAISLVRKNVSSAHAETINKELGEAIDEWLAEQPDHIIYGSLPAGRQTFKARKASDLDIAVI